MTKKKQNKRQKLSALILLLFLTVVMLGTSTYAWFTANKTVSIEKIDVNVGVSSGLQISTDATNWKTKVSNDDITTPTAWTANSNMFPSELTPVSTGGEVDATTGFMQMYSGVVGTDTQGEFTLTSASLLADEKKGTTGKYIAFDIFLRTETAGNVYLTTDSNVTPKVTNGTAEEDKGLKNASRVAFVVEGNADATTAAATMQGWHGATKDKVTIWEPNAGSHTSYGVSAANEYYAKTVTVGDANTALAWDGIYAPITTGVRLNKANKTDNATYFEAVGATSGIASLITTNASPTAYSVLMNLAKGVTKIRIYMWIEGNDVDCENNASGSNISYNVVISQNSSAA